MKAWQEMISNTKLMRQDKILSIALIAVISLIIVINLIYEAIDFIKLSRDTSNEIHVIDQITQHTLKPIASNTTNISSTQSPLFGTSPTEAGAALSSLYTLIGTKFSPSNPSKALAFIQIDSDDNDVFTVGDKLPKGGTIESIDENSITVIYRGIKEKLQVPWDSLTDGE